MEADQKTISDFDLRYIANLQDPDESTFFDHYIEQFLEDRGLFGITKILCQSKKAIDYTVVYLFLKYPRLRQYIKKLYEIYSAVKITGDPPYINHDWGDISINQKIGKIKNKFLQDHEFAGFIDLFHLIDTFSYFLRPVHIFYKMPKYRKNKRLMYPVPELIMIPFYTKDLPLFAREMQREFMNELKFYCRTDTYRYFHAHFSRITIRWETEMEQHKEFFKGQMEHFGYKALLIELV